MNSSNWGYLVHKSPPWHLDRLTDWQIVSKIIAKVRFFTYQLLDTQWYSKSKNMSNHSFAVFSLRDSSKFCTFALWKCKARCTRKSERQVEGQDEDVDDFPSAKVHRRCKMTKSPILLRSKPVVKPFLQWALNGRTDYERQTFISLYCSYY